MKSMDSCNILVVDDTKVNIEILVEILGNQYEVSVATGGHSGIQMSNMFDYDLILLDIMMPEIDGYTVLEALKANAKTEKIPVILISALSDVKNKTKGFRLGAVDYIVKPFNAEEVLARVNTHLSLRLAQMAVEEQNELLEKRVYERTQEIALIQQATMMSFATLAEFRDMETGAHIKRIKEYTRIIAKGLMKTSKFSSINNKYIEMLVQSCPLHDIGKVGVPDAILLKNGSLTPDEYESMKKHTVFGKLAIEAVENDMGILPFLHLAKEIAYTHHEKWDGSGYPQGLIGEQIPLSGRIVALADVFDGLVSRRVYKPPFTLSVAVGIILEGKGSHFDPVIVDVFIEHLEMIRLMGIQQADSEEERAVLREPYL
jgi:putative two-component system response regulator